MAEPSTKTKYVPNFKNAAVKNDQMMLNELKQRNSVFFGVPEKDGNVHIQIQPIVDAKSNKKINMAQGIYVAQGLKTMGIKSNRVITQNGARALGTKISNPNKKPHVEITASIKLDDKGKEELQKENEKLAMNNDGSNDYLIKKNEYDIETGFKHVAYTYFPTFAVDDKNALKNAFRIPNTPDIDMAKLKAYEESFKKVEGTVIDGNTAKDWKEHVKNCMSGNEVVLSKEKAHEFAVSMINDLENGQNMGDPYVFQKAARNASIELANEAKQAREMAVESELGINLEHEAPGKEQSREDDNSISF